MKQILQSLKNGEINIEEVPAPTVDHHGVLVQSSVSLVSSGTERMLLEFGRSSVYKKAKENPERVKEVLNKLKTDGLFATYEAVTNKLDQPLPLGYCNVGKVIAVGSGVGHFGIGDRVVSNGCHADIVSVSANLCARVPSSVSDEEASFTVLGAIALQGIRLASPNFGETFMVYGLGVVGLLTVQLLKAAGCRVLATDVNEARVRMAERFGAVAIVAGANVSTVEFCHNATSGLGVDGVLIATASNSSDTISEAANTCRQRGRIVLVGTTGLELNRNDFYKKEITFQISSSYGPGRYDQKYEIDGQDYPIGYVRWTAQRNFEAILAALGDGSLNVKPMISHRFEIERALDAYKILLSSEPSLGIILQYRSDSRDNVESPPLREDLCVNERASQGKEFSDARVSFIGAGSYAQKVLLKYFARHASYLSGVTSKTGLNAGLVQKKYGFKFATTDSSEIFSDPSTDIVVIATRHDSHAKYVIQALEHSKHVYVEKPLCINSSQLEQIQTAYKEAQTNSQIKPKLIVGFNRRFSPITKKAKELCSQIKSPMVIVVTVNAGTVPLDHWTQNNRIGGGRIVGEACHFIDLARHLAGSSIKSYNVSYLDETPDSVILTLTFSGGSVATINYLTNGSKLYSKERIEIYIASRILVIDNFKTMIGYGWKNFKSMRLWRQNKGNEECVKEFLHSIKSEIEDPIPFNQIIEVSKLAIEVGRCE